MTLHVLLKTKSFLTAGLCAETDLICAGTEQACKQRLQQIVDEELLDFDIDDPDTWVEELTGEANEGECMTTYDILPVDYDVGYKSVKGESLQEKLENACVENKQLEERIKLVREEASDWQTRFLAVKNAVDKIAENVGWLVGIPKYGVIKEMNEKYHKNET